MASPTQWPWIWASSGIWWRTGNPGVLQSVGSQKVGHGWATEQQQEYTILKLLSLLASDTALFPFIRVITIRHWTSLVAQMVKRLPTMWETQFYNWVGKIPWRRKWQPTSVFMPGKSHGLRNLVGYRPWDRKESDTTERLHFHFQTWYKQWSFTE